MSEVDNASDSDWLDIANGHESDFNDSLSSQDSDRDELNSRPHSRRSSISMGSSKDSEVEAWEGFVDDSEDEAAAFPPAFIPDIDNDQDPAEDQRVKDALDQSLMGTLSASRSSAGHSSSAHTSIRDLRLSFPDPLTSSRDELNRSYEDVSPSEMTFSDADDLEMTPPTIGPLPRDLSVTPEVQRREAPLPKPTTENGLDIVLYGYSSQIKWSFVEDLVRKAAIASGHTLLTSLENGNDLVQTLRLEKQIRDAPNFYDAITVYDRTNDFLPSEAFDYQDILNKSSLAIVYLPTPTLPLLSSHTLYLPVYVSGAALGSNLDPQDIAASAEDDWDLLSVPLTKILQFDAENKFSVFNSEELGSVTAPQVHRALQALSRKPKKTVTKSVSEQASPVNAATIFALMSLIMGFAFNTAFQPSVPVPTPTARNLTSENSVWLAMQSNQSIIPASATELRNSPSASTLKDVALSVYHPGTTSLSLTSTHATSLFSSLVSSSKALACRECNSVALKPQTSKEASVYSAPDTQLTEAPKPAIQPPLTIIHAKQPEATTTAMNLRLVNTIADAIGVTSKALVKAANNDVGELVEAMDELVNAIKVQADYIVKQSKGKAREIGDQVRELGDQVQGQFQYRNNRARDRAREFTNIGLEFLKDRTDVAKKNAHLLKQTLVESEKWRMCQREQDDGKAWLKEGKLGRKKCRRASTNKEAKLRRATCHDRVI